MVSIGRFLFLGGEKMEQTIYLIIGVPGVGKSWVIEHEDLKGKFEYVPHDDFQDGGYLDAIVKVASKAEKPILIEAPFSISQIMSPLQSRGKKVVPVFILESDAVLSDRYKKRDGKAIITGHLTRQKTYAIRAKEHRAFSGTSEEVLAHLKSI